MEEIQSDVSLATLHASAIANALHTLEVTTVVNLDEQTTVAGQAQAKSVIANLQQILQSLLIFSATSPSYFIEAELLYSAIMTGLEQSAGSWDASSKLYQAPSQGQDMDWRQIIHEQWEKFQTQNAGFETVYPAYQAPPPEPKIELKAKTFEAGQWIVDGSYTMDVIYVDGVYSPELTEAYMSRGLTLEELKIIALELVSVNDVQRVLTGKDPITGEKTSRLLAPHGK